MQPSDIITRLSQVQSFNHTRYIYRPAAIDPINSSSIFDTQRKNEFGEMFCVAPALSHEQAVKDCKRLNRGEPTQYC